MLTVLQALLFVQVAAIAFDFVAGIYLLWGKSASPQPSIHYFDGLDELLDEPGFETVTQSEDETPETQPQQCVETVTQSAIASQVQHIPGTVTELRKLAQAKHIKGARAMNRRELLAAIA